MEREKKRILKSFGKIFPTFGLGFSIFCDFFLHPIEMFQGCVLY